MRLLRFFSREQIRLTAQSWTTQARNDDTVRALPRCLRHVHARNHRLPAVPRGG
jgi:hypothetical protein